MSSKILTRKMVDLTRGLSPCEVMRYAIVLVMMVVGVNGVWGQVPDYSGTYYIGSNASSTGYTTTPANNYYICPTEGWLYYQPTNNWSTDGETYPNPFLTTYKCRSAAYHSGDASNAVWTIEKAPAPNSNYYYIKHNKDGKYWVSNGKITGTSNANRMRVHLEAVADGNLDDKVLFSITPYSDNKSIVISPKSSAGWNGNYKWYTVNNGNKDYLVGNGSNGGPTNYTATGGILGLYTEGDINARFVFEDIILPVFEQQDDNTITITCPGCSIYYTTDGSTPDINDANQLYSEPITMLNPVTTVKAIAVKAKAGDETLDTYSRCVTFTTQLYIGSSNPYLFQSVECTDFYMMPGDVSNNNTTVNTSSLFRSTMAWTFTNAGYEGGVQYYYIKNGTSYLYRTSDNVYIKASSDFDSSDGYKFFIVQGYDADSNPDGYCIVPKGITNNTYCLFKSGYSDSPTEVLANAKPDVVKGGNNARIVARGRWNFITYSAPGNVLPASLVTLDASSPTYFKIENVGTLGQYMSSPATEYVGTATLGNDALAWYIIDAGSENGRKYYYIVHKSGKYLKFNKATTVNNDQSSVLDLPDYDASASDRYQFVFAKSTIDGAYYIVPKGLEDVSYNNYYALYLDGTNPIKSNKNRQSDSYKWKFVPFCANPVFTESEGSITLSCATTGAEIHYTDNGTEPDESSTTYSSSTNWASSDQVRIKAIGVIKDGSVVVSTSEVVTLLNKPDVTLGGVTFIYKGTEHRPEVTLTIGSGETITSAPNDPATYQISYSNNITAGTASVTITDLDENDNWYIWNVPTTNFTIDKKMLTVTADNKTVEYGHEPPTYTVTIEGFENGEGVGVLQLIPSCTCEYTAASPKGSYTIVPSGGEDENYAFTYVNGTLTVAAAFVTLTANSGTVTYNGAEQTVTGYTCSVDGLSFTNAGVSASGSGTDVGTYPVTFTGVTENVTTDNTGDYVVNNIVNGTLTINPAAATVTADNKTKTYGETDPTLTATVTGLYGSDALTYSLTRATGNNVGDYVITPTGDAAQGNYTVSFVPGTFTINQKALTITANNHSIEYGNAPDNNGVTYDGFITGENENTAGVFTGTLVYDYNSANDGSGTSYSTTIPQGTFYIIPGGLTATNYIITYAYGTLTVGPRSIGDGSIASGFTLSFGEGGAIILMDGENLLELTTDYTIGDETTSTSGRYSGRTVSGTGNYTGYFAIRNANVNFQTDDDQVEWSATFVAENAAGIASNNSANGHALPEGVRAFIITAIIDGEWAIPEPLDYIPEGIPVILVSDKASGGFEVKDASGHTAINGTQKDANMLIETTASTPFAARAIYLLSHNEFVHNMAGDLAAGKVYLDPASGGGGGGGSRASSRLRIMWDAVTGIGGITETGNAESRNDAWYTLDGRKLNRKPTQKGMYITNGKKVVKN